MFRPVPIIRYGLIAIVLLLGVTAPTFAADKVRVGKAVPFDWGFLPLYVGNETGIYARYGIDLEIIDFPGSARLVQGLNAEAADIGLDSGPVMAFTVKGANSVAVAAVDGPPTNFAIVVVSDSPIKTVADLKSKQVSITTVGSLTEWLAKRVSQAQGWGSDGYTLVALGNPEAGLAALRTHQVDASLVVAQWGYLLEERKEGRIVTKLGDYAPHFHTHVVVARRDLIQQNPDLVQRFLKGFFASVAYMKANKAKTVATGEEVLHISEPIASRTYDSEIATTSNDGNFDPKAIEVLKDSFLSTGVLKDRPSNDQMFTPQFVPVHP